MFHCDPRTRILNSHRYRKIAHLAKAAFLIAAMALPMGAQAQLVSQIDNGDDPNRGCGADYLGNNWNCNASDIAIAQVLDIQFEGNPTYCVKGDPLVIQSVTLTYSINPGSRNDLVMYIADQEGTDPRLSAGPGQSCTAYSLPGPFNPTPNASNPWGDVDGDQCGDLGFSVVSAARTFTNIPVACQDNDGDGIADLQIMLTYDQNAQAACGNGPGQSFPTNGGSPSKCDYELRSTELPVAGTITVIKNTVGGDDTFNFSWGGGGNPAANFPITTTAGAGSERIVITSGLGSSDFEVAEVLQADWGFVSASCVDENQQPVGTPVSIGNFHSVGSLTVDAGDNLTCTFDNQKLGSITVEKQTDPDGSPQTFGFNVNGETPTLTDGQTHTISNLAPGQYTATEAVPNGWTLTSITCNDGNSTGDTGSATATFNVEAGEDVTCTFNNAQNGTIIVEKQTDPDGSAQTFGFIGDAAGTISDGGQIVVSDLAPGQYISQEAVPNGWTLTSITCDDGDSSGDIQSGIATFNLAAAETVTCTFTNTIQRGNIVVQKVTDPTGSTQSFDFTTNYGGGAFSLTDGQSNDSGPLLPTSENGVPYVVGEDPVLGWDVTSATCDDGSPINAIDLSPGETVTCTFTNTIQRGNIVVQKVTDPTGSAQSFDFTTNYGGGAFSLTDGASDDSGPLVPSSEAGSYSVVETVPAGWDLTSATCDDGSPVNAIDLGPSETVTCTFNNTQLGRIIVEKQTDPDGSNVAFLFTGDFHADTGLADGGQIDESDLSPGTYTTQETVPPGWDLTSITCDDANSSGDPTTGIATINLEAGETVSCTFLNTQDNPGITLDKAGTLNDDDGTAGVSAGDTIDYIFTVDNIGNVTLTNVSVTDPLPGLSAISCPSGNPIPILAVGATEVCTASYTLTQADIDAGQVANTATAAGTPPDGPDVTDTGSETIPLAQSPGIALDKAGTLNDDDGTAGVSAGDTIDYTFTVDNTGNVTLTNVSVTDPLPGLSAISCPSGNPIPVLAVGATEVCTASYTLTQADIDAGQLVNTATADSDETEPVTDTETIPLAQSPGIALDKAGTLNDDDGTPGNSPGDTIDYTFTVDNTGNVTLTNVSVTDPLPGLSAISCPSGNPIPVLAVGATEVCTASYTLTQADIDTGRVINTATADSDETEPVTDTEVVPPATEPELQLNKTGTLNDGGDGVADVGDTINYDFRVTNIGNLTLTNVSVTDPLPGLSAISCPSGNPIPTLLVGATEVCTASYTLTQADIDAGQVVNTATADSDQTEPVTDTETIPLAQSPGIALDKVGMLDDGGDGFDDVGDVINYSFSVTNTGNVTLTNVTIADPLITVVGGPIASLAVGATDSTTFTGSYVLTQADIDAGSFTNTATANSNEGATDTDSDTQSFRRLPSAPLEITTLNPLGLLLMALLMMGVGAVGLRRQH